MRPEAAAKLCHRRPIRRVEGVGGEPVRDHQRAHSLTGHLVLHVTAHRRDDGGRAEAVPADSFEAKSIVGVPENACALPYAGLAHQPVEVENRIGGLPFLGENHRVAVPTRLGEEEVRHQMLGQRLRVFRALGQISVVDAAGMVAAQPLGPAVQMQRAVDLVAG